LSDPVRLTVAQALIRFLGAQSVERDGRSRRLFAGCFGILGHGNVAGLGQALQVERSLPFHQARNEQAMVHIASGYARQATRLGTFVCTASVGPGSTNMVTGAALATINRLPVLLLAGDTFATRRSHPVLQGLECADDGTISVNDALRPVSAYFDRVERPEQLYSAALEATRVLTDPALTGAVTLALPLDVQTEALEVPEEFLAPRTWPIARRPAEEDAIAAAGKLVRAAARPLIVAGGGVIYSEAHEALRELAEATGIPVCETQSGRGALPSSHQSSLGAIGATGTRAANALAAEADLVIGIGTRWTDFTTASKSLFQDPEVRFLNVNVARLDAVKLGALAIEADARAGMEALTAAVAGHWVADGWAARAAAARRDWLDERERICAATGPGLTQQAVIGAVNEAAGDDGTVVCAAGSMPGELHRLWLASGPSSYKVEYGYSCMGYEVPGAIGAKLADPSREVYALVGDGSWLMMSGELVTAISERVRLTIVIVDNGGYASIGALSRSLGQGGYGTILARRDPGEQLDPPDPDSALPIDLAANAASLGATVFVAETAEALRAALAKARGIDGPAVIWAPVDRTTTAPAYAWWDVPVAEVADAESVRAARGRYESDRQRQRALLGWQ
jgi:3D-(3,5/4)-trihydroxycyclohexane-1,2-dione acylhydrolase (decyclizing)